MVSDFRKIEPAEVFPGEKSRFVDFEIVFAALIATILLSIPKEPIPGYVRAVAILLLVLTLIRSVSLMNPFVDRERIMYWTMAGLDLLTIVAFIYLFKILGEWLTVLLPIVDDSLIVTGLLIPVFTLGSLLVHELVFRDFFIWASLILYNGSVKHGDEALGVLLRKRARAALNNSLANDVPEALQRLKTENIEGFSPSLRSKIILVFAVLVSIIIYYAMLRVSYLLFGEGLTGILLFLSAVFIMIPIDFWYSRYGNMSFGEIADALPRYLLIFLILLIMGFFL